MVKKIYSKFQFLIETKVEPLVKPSLRLKEIFKFHLPNALRMPFCLLQTSPWLKKFFKFNHLQCSRMAHFSSEKLHHGWRKFSNSAYSDALKWLFLALKNFTRDFFKFTFSNALEWLYLALKNFTMVEEIYEILTSQML